VLVQTKLHAPVARERVARPQLLQSLTMPPRPRLALLRAPAGAGKTTLLAQWAGSPDEHRPFAWVALDDGDNDPIRFWAYVLEALGGAAPGVGKEALALLQAPGTRIDEEVLPTLINDLAELGAPLVLVFDDYHVIRDPAVHRTVGYLIEHAPRQVEVAVASRTEPPLPIARLRARGELHAIGERGLRFTLEEAEQLFNDLLALGVDRDDVTALWQRTEGWAAGLYLAALSLRGRESAHAFVADFAGDDRFVVDYLAEEVLAELDDELRGFLLRTSILERLCAPLCDVVLERDDSAARIAEFERANLLLVPLDDRREWYRYHHLFGDLLRLELERAYPDELPELHRRASRWCAEAGLPDEAIRHAIAAGDLGAAADLVALHYSPAVQGGQTATAARWLSLLSDDAVRADARLCYARVVVIMSEGRHADSVPWLEAMARGELPGPFGDGTTSVQAGVAVARCMLSGNTGDIGAAASACRSAVELDVEGAPWHAIATIMQGHAQLWLGDHAAAVSLMERGVALAAATGVLAMPQVFGLGHLGLVAALRGEREGAARLAEQALEIAAGASLLEHWATSTAHTVRGAVRGSLDDLRRGTELGHRGIGPVDLAHSLLALAEGERDAGDRAAASRTLDEARVVLARCPDPGVLPALFAPVERSLGAVAPAQDSDELSDRELAVLRLLPTRLSQREIGDELYVSLNTVKTHTRNVFRKLGVSRREDAVERARAQGLIG
jgi:LuxR family transcriptional regulator, maltose regulon positive regulatory protein